MHLVAAGWFARSGAISSPTESILAMPADDDLSQSEKRRVVLQDADVRRQQQTQGSTFKAFADAEAQIPGRFASVAASHVVGSTATPKYPAASTPFQRDPVPDEPPTGYCIDEMEPLSPTGVSPPVDDTGPASESDATPSPSAPAPLVGDVQRAADAGTSSAVAAQRKASLDKMG